MEFNSAFIGLNLSHRNSAKPFFISEPHKENSNYEEWETRRMIKTRNNKIMMGCGIRKH
jgi:hypothetical protein